jgi:hypothetical protein
MEIEGNHDFITILIVKFDGSFVSLPVGDYSTRSGIITMETTS